MWDVRMDLECERVCMCASVHLSAYLSHACKCIPNNNDDTRTSNSNVKHREIESKKVKHFVYTFELRKRKTEREQSIERMRMWVRTRSGHVLRAHKCYCCITARLFSYFFLLLLSLLSVCLFRAKYCFSLMRLLLLQLMLLPLLLLLPFPCVLALIFSFHFFRFSSFSIFFPRNFQLL